MNGCNSLQVSTNITVMVGSQPVTVSNDFTAGATTGLVADSTIDVPASTTLPAPVGAMTLAQVECLYIENLDEANPLFVSLNANGSSPCQQVGPGQHIFILMPIGGVAYYLTAGSNAVAVRVLAVGD